MFLQLTPPEHLDQVSLDALLELKYHKKRMSVFFFPLVDSLTGVL